jgi:hypothetical protein
VLVRLPGARRKRVMLEQSFINFTSFLHIRLLVSVAHSAVFCFENSSTVVCKYVISKGRKNATHKHEVKIIYILTRTNNAANVTSVELVFRDG